MVSRAGGRLLGSAGFVGRVGFRGYMPTPTQEHTKVKGPLTDITNTPKTRVGSWKKKARAHGIETGGPLVALPEKRHSDFLNEVSEDYCRPGKDPRTTPMDIVSAEANNSQPHRDQ